MSVSQYAMVHHRGLGRDLPVLISSLTKPAPSPLVLAKWQNMLDFVTNLFGVARTRITKVNSHKINTLLTSHQNRGEYTEENFGEGNLIEGVLGGDGPLKLEDVLVDGIWSQAGASTRSFIGYPIKWPDNEVFGTLTLENDHQISFEQRHEDILSTFVNLINTDLALLMESDNFNQRSTYFENKIQPIKTGICIYDDGGKIISWNGSAELILGYKMEELLGHQVDIIFPIAAINAHEHGGVFEVESKNGDAKSLLIDKSKMLGLNENMVNVLSFSDQSDYARLKKDHSYGLEMDDETGVYNHHSIIEILNQEAKRSIRYKESFSVIMVKINGYPFIDQLHGEGCQSLVIQTLSVILKNETRDIDRIGRLEDDLFIVLLPNTPIEGTRKVGDRIEKMCQRYSDDDTPFTAQIGYYLVDKITEHWYEEMVKSMEIKPSV